jgi:3-methyl-2-oxobutanoate hydroxymethyltransferase
VSAEHTPSRRLTTHDLAARKLARSVGAPMVWLTAYSAPTARAADDVADAILVGDSLGMTVYGMDSTLGVTLDMMIAHGAAVVRASSRACVIIDMPFASYQTSPQQAYTSAARVMAETGCAGVKLEGGAEMAETITFLVARGIPVVGHVGLTPQSVNRFGGYRAQGRTADEAKKIMADAKAVAAAGAFALVIEKTIEPLARAITKTVSVPTIGIGASLACDGQVLVMDDVTGLFDLFRPKFVKRYAETGRDMKAAAAAYAADVRAGKFPALEHCFAAMPAPKKKAPTTKSTKKK